jgi:uncharacterized Zn-finger protein
MSKPASGGELPHLILRGTFSIVPDCWRLEIGGPSPCMKRKDRQNKKSVGEQVIQKFPNRCPYCDEVISYEDFRLDEGENEVKCPSCKNRYIKIVPGPFAKRKKK